MVWNAGAERKVVVVSWGAWTLTEAVQWEASSIGKILEQLAPTIREEVSLLALSEDYRHLRERVAAIAARLARTIPASTAQIREAVTNIVATNGRINWLARDGENAHNELHYALRSGIAETLERYAVGCLRDRYVTELHKVYAREISEGLVSIGYDVDKEKTKSFPWTDRQKQDLPGCSMTIGTRSSTIIAHFDASGRIELFIERIGGSTIPSMTFDGGNLIHKYADSFGEIFQELPELERMRERVFAIGADADGSLAHFETRMDEADARISEFFGEDTRRFFPLFAAWVDDHARTEERTALTEAPWRGTEMPGGTTRRNAINATIERAIGARQETTVALPPFGKMSQLLAGYLLHFAMQGRERIRRRLRELGKMKPERVAAEKARLDAIMDEFGRLLKGDAVLKAPKNPENAPTEEEKQFEYARLVCDKEFRAFLREAILTPFFKEMKTAWDEDPELGAIRENNDIMIPWASYKRIVDFKEKPGNVRYEGYARIGSAGKGASPFVRTPERNEYLTCAEFVEIMTLCCARLHEGGGDDSPVAVRRAFELIVREEVATFMGTDVSADDEEKERILRGFLSETFVIRTDTTRA